MAVNPGVFLWKIQVFFPTNVDGLNLIIVLRGSPKRLMIDLEQCELDYEYLTKNWFEVSAVLKSNKKNVVKNILVEIKMRP